MQNDEASVRFEDTIDQLTLGHLWAAATLGAPPVTTAWQADPFGHSTSQAFIYSQMVQDGLVLGRPASGGDPTTLQSASLWHPMASFPDGGAFDNFTLLLHDQWIGYWQPFRAVYPLLLAGHTHCGQIAPPFLRGVVARSPKQGWKRLYDPRYRCGLIHDPGRLVVVTAGVGAGSVPIRLDAPPDLWRLTLRGR